MTKSDEEHIEHVRRKDVETRLLDETVQAMHEKFDVQTELEIFRDRLVHILFSFERDLEFEQSPSKKEHRKQLEKVYRATARLIAALGGLSSHAKETLNYDLEFDHWQSWVEENGSIFGNYVSEAPTVHEMRKKLEKIAAQAHPDKNRETTADTEGNGSDDCYKPPKRTALDQLIIDVEGTLLTHVDYTEKGLCYYSAVDDDYRGLLFEFTVELLDSYAPNSYFSRGALGQRIIRVLKKDKEG